MNNPKILLFDIENAPNEAYIWDLYTEVVSDDMIKEPWYVLCWAANWLGEKKVMSSALVDFPKEYKKDPKNDRPLLEKLWSLLNRADIIIAHNGKKFDVRKVNARFIMHGMPPPAPYRIIDTLTAARQHFYFTSNKLDNLGKYLKVGEKVDTGGFKLWRLCMAGDRPAWAKMVRYCRNDITLLKKVYLKLRPYMSNHPNLNTYQDTCGLTCANCGSSSIQKRGYKFTNKDKYQRYSCNTCGSWFQNGRGLVKIKMNERK